MKSLAPKKSKRPRSREDALNQRRLDMAAKYGDSVPEKSKPVRPMSREDGLMNMKLKSIFRSDQGTMDAKNYKNGGCVMAGRGGKYKGSM